MLCHLAVRQRPRVKLWEPSPLDVDDPEPPEYMRPHAFKVESWRRAWELRQELEAAVQS